MDIEEIKKTKRHLPHWTFNESTYFITFHTKNSLLTINEQIIVKDHIVEGKDVFYTLYAVVVMPDHVHIILKPNFHYVLKRIMKGIKGVSAHKIYKIRGTHGRIWQVESFDRIIRDQKEFNEKLNYMFKNPIKRGLTEDTWKYHGWFLNDELDYSLLD